MNKILTIVLLSIFMPLASQVNAQGTERWTFKPILKRITEVPAASEDPVELRETEIRRNTANNLYIGLFIKNKGEPVAPTRGSSNSNSSNGVVGAAQIEFNIDSTLTSDMLIDPASGNPFTWHSSDEIAHTSNDVLAGDDGYKVSIVANLESTAEKSAVRCEGEEWKCDIFLGTLEFDLDSYPNVAGEVVLSISNFSPLLHGSDATKARVKTRITDAGTIRLIVTRAVPALVLTAPAPADQTYVAGKAIIPALILPSASGGTAGYTYSLTDNLPSGLTFNAATRTLSGTPTAETATVTLTYTVTDAASITADASFRVTVMADNTAPTVTMIERTTPLDKFTSADEISWTVTFSEPVMEVDAADFAVSGTTATLAVTSTSGSDTSYQVTASMGDLADLGGAVTLRLVRVQDITDMVGNALNANGIPNPNDVSYTLDNNRPTVSIKLAEGVTQPINSAFGIVITFSEDVSGFEFDDISVTNVSSFLPGEITVGVASGFSGSGASYTAMITPPLTAGGTILFRISGNVVVDVAGNSNEAAALFVVRFDNTAPTVSIVLATGVSQPVNSAFGIEITFSEDVSGFEFDEISVTNVGGFPFGEVIDGVSGFSGSGASYTAMITPPLTADGIIILRISGNVAVDIADNSNEAADLFVVRFNNTAPTVTMIERTTPLDKFTSADVLTWTVTFSETVVEVDAADFAVSGTTATLVVTAPTLESDTSYQVAASTGDLADLDSAVTLRLVEGQNITDVAGNALNANGIPNPNDVSYTLDNNGPTVSIKLAEGVTQPINSAFGIEITFSEDVSGFEFDDISVTNVGGSPFGEVTVGVASGFSGSGASYTAMITPPLTADGTISLGVSGNVAVDVAGNSNEAATLFVVRFDNAPPTVAMIERTTPTTETTNADSLTWTVTFSETVMEVDAADFAVSGTTITLPVTSTLGSDRVYQVTASTGELADLNGAVTLTLVAGQDITDVAGNALNDNGIRNPNEVSYTLDNNRPTVTIEALAIECGAFTATFTFNKDVTGFEEGDIQVIETDKVNDGATTSDFHAINARIYTALITPTTVVGSSITLDIGANVAEDAAGNRNEAAEKTATIDASTPDLTGDGFVNEKDALLIFFVLTFRKSIETSPSVKAGIVRKHTTGNTPAQYQKTVEHIADWEKHEINNMNGKNDVNEQDALLAFFTLKNRDAIRATDSTKAGIVGAFISGTEYQKTIDLVNALFKNPCPL